MIYLSNAFSLSMLPSSVSYSLIKVEETSKEEVKELLSKNQFISAVGHEGTSQFISELLGVQVTVNRSAIKLEKGDVLIVLQLLQRLAEGKVLTREEIEKIEHKWFKVTLL
jgi:hypothetical protein